MRYTAEETYSAANRIRRQTDLSGIRYFHEQSGSKNKLFKNDHLDLPKRAVGKENPAWAPEEISKARAVVREMGRVDVEISLDLVPMFGCGIEELCRRKVAHLMHAEKYGQLIVQGKRKKVRHILVDADQMKIIKKYSDYSKVYGRAAGGGVKRPERVAAVDEGRRCLRRGRSSGTVPWE